MRLFYLMRFANLMANSAPNGSRSFLADQTTSTILRTLIPTLGGKVITNVVIPTKDNKYIQIGHIYLTTHGIFLIESKNIGGKVLGSDNDEHWVLYFPNNPNDRYQVVNAVKQNQERINALERLLGIEDEIYNIVTFVKADVRDIHSDHVYYPFDMKKVIYSTKDDVMYTDEEIEEMYNTILDIKKNPILSYEQYVDMLGNIEIKYHHKKREILKLS